MLSAGSPPASTPCAAAPNAEATARPRCSTRKCSEPGSFSSGAPTGSPPTKPNASNSSWSGVPAWEALAELHGLYLAEDYQAALAALRRFAALYTAGEIPEFGAVMETVSAWENEILDWHLTGRPSNGRLEGTNNLLQILRRTAHGFTNPYNYAARGLLLT